MPNTETLSPADKLKRHFSSRVLHQSQQVVELWQQLPESDWSAERLNDFILQVEKLLRFAKRFEANKHLTMAHQLLSTLSELRLGSVPDSTQLQLLNNVIITLSETALRHSDNKLEELPIKNKVAVYIALNDDEKAALLTKQMHYFRITASSFTTPTELSSGLISRHPSAIIIDTDFGGTENGLRIVDELQRSRSTLIPIIFTYSGARPNLEQQLKMLRGGSLGLFKSSNIHTIISETDKALDTTPEAPFKILVVDDSRSQARYTENLLNKAGILCEAINDPLLVLDALRRFDPDLVLMDMYMPHCTGVELARVIRQQAEHINLPIIYLSGEEDKELQLAAMTMAGDDFLTKPVEENHLLTTVRNRISRARQLYDLIARDSLTGLLNHTHTLGALQNAMDRQPDSSICFVMIDIDHFKRVNDNYGHPAGDSVIRNLALFLRQHLRKTDPIGRYGGEEFAAILLDATEEQAAIVMDGIRANFAQLIHTDDGLTVTFSCGVAQWRGESASELVSLADQALYQSKHEGRNQVTAASALR